MLEQCEGSHAVAHAVALSRPEVICAYPISPQTHIVEGLGELVKDGTLAPCEFINVESEFAALSVAIGSSAAGARTYTAVSYTHLDVYKRQHQPQMVRQMGPAASQMVVGSRGTTWQVG